MTGAARSTVPSVRRVAVRSAQLTDCGLILELIRELAVYEKLEHEVSATPELLSSSLFGPTPRAECLIAECDGIAAGFAIFFHNYSTFLGKPGLYLEDLFVRDDYRGQGIGFELLRARARIAIERDCGRMEWWVLDWNEPALAFYRRFGAQPMDEWTVQRLDRIAIEKLAA